ncbi:hypothetical protein BT63DRAFT_450977 [Microthyrium microscopicum]|uniref:Uncharacterized protein n=1 Tax=Microthyrium microscopicum TaxID=703497 RepID=A0A6A6UMD3_9PEZI|nr:hypothetical protein BT63DRAFT_450977 [Microthyrium microscopicum]
MAEMSLSWMSESQCAQFNEQVDRGEVVAVLFFSPTGLSQPYWRPVARLWYQNRTSAPMEGYAQFSATLDMLARALSIFDGRQVRPMVANSLPPLQAHLNSMRGNWNGPLPAGADVVSPVLFHLLVESTTPPSIVAERYPDLALVLIRMGEVANAIQPFNEPSVLIRFAEDIITAANTSANPGSSTGIHATPMTASASSARVPAAATATPVSAGRRLAISLSSNAPAAAAPNASQAVAAEEQGKEEQEEQEK